ncbi:hypothetical protein GGR51DRAFT_498822 [Nemania sp. FL0031]|nr:hypothetical protein GGR51DRAFT_498822 [Nemania sp. FL0031]
MREAHIITLPITINSTVANHLHLLYWPHLMHTAVAYWYYITSIDLCVLVGFVALRSALERGHPARPPAREFVHRIK